MLRFVSTPVPVPAVVLRLYEAVMPRSARRAVVALWASLLVTFLVVAALGKRRLYQGSRLGLQSYPDLVVGSTSWSGAYKDFDFLLIAGLIAGLFTLYALASAVLNRMRSPRLDDVEGAGREVPLALHVWGGLAAYSGSVALMQQRLPVQELSITGALGASLLVSHLWAFWRRWDVREFSQRYVAALMAALGLGLSALGAAMLVRCFVPSALVDAPRLVVGAALPLLVAATVLAMVVGPRLSVEMWRRLALGAQALAPLLILCIAGGVHQQGDTFFQRHVPAGTRWALLALAVAGIVAILARVRRAPSGPLAWPTVVAVAAWVTFRHAPWSLLDVTDDFHLGELILPWQQVVWQGKDLYYGFVSIQWWMGLLYGALNALLFEDTGASFYTAYLAWPVIMAGLTAGLLYRRVGAGWALVLSLFVVPLLDRQLLVLPLLLVLASPALLARPWTWLLAWGGLSLLHTFYNPSSGVALGVGLVPVALLMGYRALRAWKAEGPPARPWVMAVVALAGLLVLALLGRQIWGLVEFIRGNGATNTTAYGVSLGDQGSGPGWFPSRSRLLWETFRIGGWLYGAVALWALLCRARFGDEATASERDSAKVLAWGSIGFAFLLVPYSMGRVDPEHMSRSGTISMMVLGTLIPLVLVLESRWRRQRLWLVPVLVGALVGLRGGMEFTEPSLLVTRPLLAVQVPPELKLTDGRELGMPRLGKEFFPPQRLEALQTFQRVLAEVLEPSETYFDLSNRSALYYFLDMPVPGVYAADFTAVGEVAQRQVLEALKRDPPPVVRLGPHTRFDGGLASLRSFRVYRWLMEQGYAYYEKDGIQLLLRPDRYAKVATPERDKAQAAGLRTFFHAEELSHIALLWGQSWKRLESRFASASLPLESPTCANLDVGADGTMRVLAEDPQVIWTLPRKLSGKEYDFLLVDLRMECEGAAWPRAQVFFGTASEPFREEHSFRMHTRPGRLLVPMGSHPEWLRGEAIERIRFDLDEATKCRTFRIADARLVRLVK
jgi:hypothetical protein